MKIVHALSWYFPQPVGGTEVYVAGLSQRLRAAGHEVLIAAPLSGLDEEERYEHEGIPVYRYPIPRQPTREECQSQRAARGTEYFHAWLAAQKADWVHFHSFTTGLGVTEVSAARRAGSRALATNHLASLGFLCQRGTLMRWGEYLCDGICKPVKCAECGLQQRGMGKNTARLLARLGTLAPDRELPGRLGTALAMPNLIRHNLRLQHELLELLDWFVMLNQWAVDTVIANGAPPEKILLNYLGVSNLSSSAVRGEHVRPEGAPIKIGYFGRIVGLKGVVELARAFAQLPRDLRVRLEFRGPSASPEEQNLLARLRDMLGRDERVSFQPAIAPKDAPAILAGYDVLCVPSVWFENGPTVMLEAHAVGTPVIGTRIGAMAELIIDGVNGRLVPPGDVPALTAALHEVASRPKETLDAWRAALPVTRTMDDIAADYLKLYAAGPPSA